MCAELRAVKINLQTLAWGVHNHLTVWKGRTKGTEKEENDDFWFVAEWVKSGG